MHIRNVNLLFKKDFKKAELSLPFTLELVIKMAKETNKRYVKSIFARVTKHVSKKVAKVKVNLNWL